VNKKQTIDRRGFIKLGIQTGGGVLALSAIPMQLTAQDAVAESEPLAQAMGYVTDATKVDTAKFPKRSGEAGANQFCHNCALYGGEADSASAPCSIFQNRLVFGKGWCNAWVAKS
jgi:hypothetical protein